MFPLLSSIESSIKDKTLIEKYDLSERSLVTNAATGAFALYKSLYINKDILFVCGKGNNGSDALALAYLCLPVAKSVKVYMHFEKGNEENEYRRNLLDPSIFVNSIIDADTIVDGLFGVKYRFPADERTMKVIEEINASKATVISLDCPSLYLVEADYTVSFMSYKREMFLPGNRARCGEITLFNPGFPEEEIGKDIKAFLLEESDYNLPKIRKDGYKNTRGHVCVVGGCTRYPGAPILSCLSAFHASAGKVSVVSNGKVKEEIIKSYPSIMVSDSLPDTQSYIVGPGWGRGSRKKLEKVIATGKPIVVDADGIKHLKNLSLNHNGVITPHLGEFRNLLNLLAIKSDDTIEEVKEVALRLECIVVLKGSTVLITDGETIYIKDGANPSLGVAGSGDVLSGIIGAFLAQGNTPLLSAINGVILHQKCGRILSEKYGFYNAEKIIEEIGRVR